ncbi:MAG TPA: alpha/beta fold hydrolase [Solirubrobacteraceae bacterium]|nr:alpha/beta fold hydrolase [Solirubrobacteraceae bacterium]
MSTRSRLDELAIWAGERGREPDLYEYGGREDQVADLWAADNGRSDRIAILIHGGFWREAYDRSSLNALASALAERGWASWNIEYRRGPGTATDALEDVYSAVLRLRELVMLSEVIVVGHSAGGQLALCTAGRLPAELTVSLAGVADLVTAAAERIGDDAVREFIGADPEEAQELYWALDPLSRVPTAAPTLLVHGAQDDRVPITQSRLYAAAASARSSPCDLLELKGADHFDLIDPRTKACRAWLKRLPG